MVTSRKFQIVIVELVIQRGRAEVIWSGSGRRYDEQVWLGSRLMLETWEKMHECNEPGLVHDTVQFVQGFSSRCQENIYWDWAVPLLGAGRIIKHCDVQVRRLYGSKNCLDPIRFQPGRAKWWNSCFCIEISTGDAASAGGEYADSEFVTGILDTAGPKGW